MKENRHNQPTMETMRAMGLVVDGEFSGVRFIGVRSPSGECKDIRVQPVTIVEDPMGSPIHTTVFRPSHKDIKALRDEMGV